MLFLILRYKLWSKASCLQRRVYLRRLILCTRVTWLLKTTKLDIVVEFLLQIECEQWIKVFKSCVVKCFWVSSIMLKVRMYVNFLLSMNFFSLLRQKMHNKRLHFKENRRFKFLKMFSKAILIFDLSSFFEVICAKSVIRFRHSCRLHKAIRTSIVLSLRSYFSSSISWRID